MIMRESAKAEALRKKLAGDMDALAGKPLKYGEKPSH